MFIITGFDRQGNSTAWHVRKATSQRDLRRTPEFHHFATEAEAGAELAVIRAEIAAARA